MATLGESDGLRIWLRLPGETVDIPMAPGGRLRPRIGGSRMTDETSWLRFEVEEGKSSKFWEIRREGAAYVVRYGKIGSKGREQRKELDSEAACAEMVQKKIAEKKRKGYKSRAPAASRLWKAVDKKDKAAAREQLSGGADPNESRDGICLLEVAIEGRANAIALALLDAGADPRGLAGRALNLVWAVLTERADVVQAFIEAGAQLDVQAIMGSPVRVAAQRGLTEIVEVLIEAGVDLDVGGVVDTPLFSAIESGHAECARILARAGASSDPARSGKRSVVTLAAKAGMADVLRALVQSGADLEHRDSFQEIDEAAFSASIQQVSGDVLDAFESGEGAVVSANLMDHVSASYEGATPLIVAAGEGHLACVEILIEAGAQLDGLDERGQAAIEHARARGHAQIVARLEEAGAQAEPDVPASQRLLLAAESGDLAALEAVLGEDVDIETKETRDVQLGRTPLMLAAAGGHTRLVDALLQAGADPNRTDDHGEESPQRPGAFWMRDDSRGRTPLHLAAEGGHVLVIERLLAAGADPSLADRQKETPLTLAASIGDAASARALIAAGADPNQRGAGRRTPLHACLENGGHAAAGLLIEAGAKLDLKSGEGDTALHIAALLDLTEIVEELLAAGANPTVKNREGERPSARPFEQPLVARLREAESSWAAEGRSAPEPIDEEEERARAARARTPEIAAPSVAELRKTYDHDTVLDRLQSDAESAGFRTLLAEVADRCGCEPDDQRASLGGYLIHVESERMGYDGLADLQAEMLAKGAFVCACGQNMATSSPRSLLVLPTADRYDAVAVLGTNGCNEDKSTEDVLRWLMQREQIHPFELLHIEHDTLQGRYTGAIDDPEELAQSMYDLCCDIVDQGAESVEALAESLSDTRRLYFWWD